MIVEVNSNKAIVVGYDSCNRWYCSEFGKRFLKCFSPHEIKIIDHKLPPNWIVSNYYYKNSEELPNWLDYGDYSDYIFFCYPHTLTPAHLLSLSYLHMEPYRFFDFDNYELLKAINDIRKFHGLENIEIPYNKEYELALMSPEERIQKQLSDELDEYLSIGEELEKQKDIKRELWISQEHNLLKFLAF